MAVNPNSPFYSGAPSPEQHPPPSPSDLDEEPSTPAHSCEKKPPLIWRRPFYSGDASPSMDMDDSPSTSSDLLQEGAWLLMYFRDSLTDRGKKRKKNETEISDNLNLASPLLKALHSLLCKASSQGMAVAELVSELVQLSGQELQGESIPRSVKLATIMRKNPYFAELENGNFTLWTKILQHKSEAQEPDPASAPPIIPILNRSNTQKKIRKPKKKKIQGIEQKIRSSSKDEEQRFEFKVQCKRGDGKKWQCREVAKPGYSWCEYHLAKHRQNHVSAKTRKLDSKLGLIPP